MNWIINSCRISGGQNEIQMLANNIFYIGFGTLEEERHKKKTNTTIKQFNTFIQKAKKGDNIYLYANKVGIIAIGEFTGDYYNPICNEEKAPDWGVEHYQCHVKVTKWNKIYPPLKYKPRPLTLYLDNLFQKKLI